MLKKYFAPILVLTSMFGLFLSPLSASAAESYILTWDEEPVAGQASPGFTFKMSGVIPAADRTLITLQIFPYDDVNSSYWDRVSPTDCNSAETCGIESVTYDGAPITYSVRNWAPVSAALAVSNRGLLLTFTGGTVDGTSVTSPGDLDSGGELVVRVAAGQFTAPNSLNSTGKPFITVGQKHPSNESSIHHSGFGSAEIAEPPTEEPERPNRLSGPALSINYFVVEGFPKFKSTLNSDMRNFINQEIAKTGSTQSKVICTGTVRGKKWTAKREALAFARATAGCDYVRTLLPSVETELKKRLISKKKQNSLTVRIRVLY